MFLLKVTDNISLKMSPPYLLLLSITLLSTLSTVESVCNSACCTAIPKNYRGVFKIRNTFLSSLPDSRRLNTLALIGTHDSAAYNTINAAEAQVMTISEQLGAGIRVFDMRVRPLLNSFKMHHGPIYLKRSFDSIVTNVTKFFQRNPKELIIMFMKVEFSNLFCTLSECEILENYNKLSGGLFVQNWKYNDTLGQHRGKILLVKADNGFDNCTIRLPCKVQNNWDISVIGTKYTAIDKWHDIKSLQDDQFDPNQHHKCYINYLSGFSDIIQGPKAVATGGYFWWGELDRTTGTNRKMYEYFRNPGNTLSIILTDFPGQGLISKITDSNKKV
ncbi:uncharacterized protein LOC123271533 isoform X1 [Cotesia glomerata]|nr:uncharacterized protein LOC123271533 isoform X1 [Cotesia glomerata]XP_044593813.1 uncharacterized protein LOC123271533 isoform X1 [Cotesia glomerata]